MPRTEVRKECPSCGLSVPLDAKVCEFCLWDFEEEDEWIDQIERLERELMEQNQKFDETVVDRMIKATLHRPSLQEGSREASAGPRADDASSEDASSEGVIAAEDAIDEDMDLELPEDQEEEPTPPPPPPDEHELGEGPRIVKPKPEIPAQRTPRHAPPGKKVRRVATRTVAGTKKPSGAVPPKGRPPVPEGARGVSKPAGTAAQPRIPTSRDSAPQRGTPAAPSRGEKKGLFSGLSKMFNVPGSSPEQAGGPLTAQPSPAGARSTAAAGQEAQRRQDRTPSPESEPAAAAPAGTKVTRKVQRKVSASAKPPAPPKPSREERPEEERAVVRVFICPLCKKEVPEDSRACGNCGAEFE